MYVRNIRISVTGVAEDPVNFPLAMGPWEDVAPDSVQNDRLLSCGDETSRCIYFAAETPEYTSNTAQLFPHTFGTRTNGIDIGYLQVYVLSVLPAVVLPAAPGKITYTFSVFGEGVQQ